MWLPFDCFHFWARWWILPMFSDVGDLARTLCPNGHRERTRQHWTKHKSFGGCVWRGGGGGGGCSSESTHQLPNVCSGYDALENCLLLSGALERVFSISFDLWSRIVHLVGRFLPLNSTTIWALVCTRRWAVVNLCCQHRIKVSPPPHCLLSSYKDPPPSTIITFITPPPSGKIFSKSTYIMTKERRRALELFSWQEWQGDLRLTWRSIARGAGGRDGGGITKKGYE